MRRLRTNPTARNFSRLLNIRPSPQIRSNEDRLWGGPIIQNATVDPSRALADGAVYRWARQTSIRHSKGSRVSRLDRRGCMVYIQLPPLTIALMLKELLPSTIHNQPPFPANPLIVSTSSSIVPRLKDRHWWSTRSPSMSRISLSITSTSMEGMSNMSTSRCLRFRMDFSSMSWSMGKTGRREEEMRLERHQGHGRNRLVLVLISGSSCEAGSGVEGGSMIVLIGPLPQSEHGGRGSVPDGIWHPFFIAETHRTCFLVTEHPCSTTPVKAEKGKRKSDRLHRWKLLYDKRSLIPHESDAVVLTCKTLI